MSTKIRITMAVDDEYADPDHKVGITEDCYLEISDALSSYGDDIEINKVVG